MRETAVSDQINTCRTTFLLPCTISSRNWAEKRHLDCFSSSWRRGEKQTKSKPAFLLWYLQDFVADLAHAQTATVFFNTDHSIYAFIILQNTKPREKKKHKLLSLFKLLIYTKKQSFTNRKRKTQVFVTLFQFSTEGSSSTCWRK